MSKYSNHDLEKKYTQLSTDQLKDIVQNHSKEYRPTVIQIILKTLKNRGEVIDTNTIEYGNESTIKHDVKSSIDSSILLLIIGVLFLIISVVLSIAVIVLRYRELSTLNIITKLAISFVSMKMAYNHGKKLDRKKYLWAFLGFISGGLTLIIISFFKKKRDLTEEEKKISNKKTKKILVISFLIVVISIPSFIFIRNYLEKKEKAESYQAYINKRIDYIENPKNGYLFYFTCDDYNYNIKAKVITSNKDSIYFKSPKYLGKKHRETYRKNEYNLENSYYLYTWVTKEKLKLAIEKDISDSGNFNGIPFRKLSNSEMKYRFDRLESSRYF